MTKALKIKESKAGKRFALCPHRDGGYAVYGEHRNYAPHVRGGIAKSWRLVKSGMSLEDAERLLESRAA